MSIGQLTDSGIKKKKKAPMNKPLLLPHSKIQNTQKIKERFLIRRNQTKRANFRGNSLFQATYNTT